MKKLKEEHPEKEVQTEEEKKELETETKSKLSDIFGSDGDRTDSEEDLDEPTSDLEEEEDEDQTGSEDEEDESTSDDDSDEDEEENAEDEDEDKDGDEEKEADAESTLPDSYVRAALHQGWKEDEVKEFFEENPKQAVKTLKNIYESTNRLSKKFSSLGRAQLEQKRKDTTNEKKSQGEKKSEFKGVDIEQLKKDYPNDPIIEGVVKPLNDALGQMKQQMDNIRASDNSEAMSASEQRAKVQNDKIIESKITDFFTRDDIKPFEDMYGTVEKGQTWDDLPQLQHQNRYAVLQQADLLLNGAAVQGEEMDIGQALNLAHMLVTDGMKEKIIRNKLKGKLKKRSNGVTLKPSKKKSKAKKVSKKKKLQTRVGKKLSKLFPRN